MLFPEVCTTCVLSTAHLPEELAKTMDAGETPATCPAFSYDSLRYGYRVYAGSAEHAPETIKPILAAAKEAGYRWVEFDCDAEPVACFPTYDW